MIFEHNSDPAEMFRAMNAAIDSGEMHMRDAIDGSSFSMSARKPHGDHPEHPLPPSPRSRDPSHPSALKTALDHIRSYTIPATAARPETADP